MSLSYEDLKKAEEARMSEQAPKFDDNLSGGKLHYDKESQTIKSEGPQDQDYPRYVIEQQKNLRLEAHIVRLDREITDLSKAAQSAAEDARLQRIKTENARADAAEWHLEAIKRSEETIALKEENAKLNKLTQDLAGNCIKMGSDIHSLETRLDATAKRQATSQTENLRLSQKCHGLEAELAEEKRVLANAKGHINNLEIELCKEQCNAQYWKQSTQHKKEREDELQGKLKEVQDKLDEAENANFMLKKKVEDFKTIHEPVYQRQIQKVTEENDKLKAEKVEQLGEWNHYWTKERAGLQTKIDQLKTHIRNEELVQAKVDAAFKAEIDRLQQIINESTQQKFTEG